MADREVGEREGDSIFNSMVSQSFSGTRWLYNTQLGGIKIYKIYFLSITSKPNENFGKGKKFSQILPPRNSHSPSHFLNCFLSAGPFASASFLSSHSPPSHNFRHCWIEKKSSDPSQVSLFLSLWYANITHVLSRGVKVGTLKEVWWKKHLGEVRGLRSASSLHHGPKHWRQPTLQHIRPTHYLSARVLQRNRIGSVFRGGGGGVIFKELAHVIVGTSKSEICRAG